MTSASRDSPSSTTPNSATKRPRTSDGANLGIDSTSKELKRRNVDGGKGCCNSVWNNQVLSPKVASWTDSFSVGILQGNMVSDKYGIKEFRNIHSTTKALAISKYFDAEKSPTGQYFSSGKHGSVTKAIEELLSLRKISESQGYLRLTPFQENKKSNLTIPEIINLEEDDESRDKSPRPTVFIDLTVESVEAEEMDSRSHSVSSRDNSPRSYIDLEAERDVIPIDSQDEDSEKKLFALDVVDSSETADLAEANPEIQGYAEDQGSGADNDCHVTEIKVCTMEDANDSNQATLTDDQCAGAKDDVDMEEDSTEVVDQATADAIISEVEKFKVVGEMVEDHVNVENQGYAEHLGNTENNDGHASQIEAYKMEDAAGSDKATLTNNQCFGAKDDSDTENKWDRVSVRIGGEKTKSSDKAAAKVSKFEKDDPDMEDKRNRVSARIEGLKAKTKSSFNVAATVSKVEKDKGARAKIERAKELKNASSDDEANVSDVEKDRGEYVGVEDDDEMDDDSDHDGLDNIWAMMSSEFKANCEDPFGDASSANPSGDGEREGAGECDHSFIFREDIGSVCRVCGLVEKEIGSIIDYQFGKSKRSGRTYSKYERTSESGSNQTIMMPDGTQLDEVSVEVSVHPRHQKVMKNHQFEGFRFLSSNLMTDNPGGCVMAHAPGSGKTFMIISFLQIFMAKYPSARPLIVLPRGILSTWKKEFLKWQVEDMPLHDFYSAKAENRSQQLEVLEKWGKERSILFLSYKQFTVIVCDIERSNTTRSCQKFLLETPSILILDEGHTPRNDDTETLTSLQKVKTPRKVVLSGTLYQNHVKEVFNVLNLVRQNFLKTDEAKSIKTRIMSKVTVLGKRSSWTDDSFYEAVERTILDDLKFRKKVHIIQDLRDITRKVLHYYKGDSLDELPGLVDFTVFLKLNEKQKKAIEVLKKCKNRFKIISDGSAIYVHPRLNSVLKQSGGNSRIDVETIDDLLLENMSELGAKAKFYLNLLHLCESTGEKLLVFSQYLGPLKFLERLTVRLKKYSVGREIFVITGDSDADIRDSSMEQFNNSSDSRVFFGSIKACGEGISLVGASRIIIMDIHLNPSVTRQAIGRAFRPGQERKVYTYRLVSSGSPEEEDHFTCFRKECIAKMWFEWNVYQGLDVFEMETVDVNNCGDPFLETERLKADVVSVCKR